jgi:acyl-CoA synthetase (AMP-forming)/AMP-acid ligase II
VSRGICHREYLSHVFDSPISFQTTPADPIVKRVETVGKVQPHVKAKLIDPSGKVVPAGIPGELCVAGYLVQKGYAPRSGPSLHRIETAFLGLDIGTTRNKREK